MLTRVEALLHSVSDSMETQALMGLLEGGSATLRRAQAELSASSESVSDVLDDLDAALGDADADMEEITARMGAIPGGNGATLEEQLAAAFAEAEAGTPQQQPAETAPVQPALREAAAAANALLVVSPPRAAVSDEAEVGLEASPAARLLSYYRYFQDERRRGCGCRSPLEFCALSIALASVQMRNVNAHSY